MAITTKDFTTLVSGQVAAIQAGASTLIDLTVGSVLRSIVEANAAMVLWLQGLILQLFAVTRAATSSGVDLDSFVLDFGLTRLAAVAATGQVTFARFTATNQATIPVGATVQTADGTQSFAVIADLTNGAYNAGLTAYLIAAGATSASVTVQAVSAGSGANVAAGQINTLTQAIPNVDTVSNALVFTNGVAVETDTALRARFVAYIASLSRATKTAIGNAILSVQSGMRYTLVENQTFTGVVQPGYFFAVVDDGSGFPPTALLNSVATAIEAIRPVTTTFGVYAPGVVTAAVVMTATIATGFDPTATKALAQAAIASYINSLTLGATLAYTRLAQTAYGASPGIVNVTLITLNGGIADLTVTTLQTIKAGTVTVN